VGQFDQTARPMAKMDGAAFFGWGLSCCSPRPRLSFVKWDDSRRLVCPGEPDRTNDLVALCRDDDRSQRETWLIAKLETWFDAALVARDVAELSKQMKIEP